MIMTIKYYEDWAKATTPDGKVWRLATPGDLEHLDPSELIFVARGDPVLVGPEVAQVGGTILVGDFREALPVLYQRFPFYIQIERVCPDCKAQPRQHCEDDCPNRSETP
jgi:hypothetical protein